MEREYVDITENVGSGNVDHIISILKRYRESGWDRLYWDGYDSTIQLYKSNQPERSKREDVKEFVNRPEKYEGPIAIDCKPSKKCDDYHKNSVIQINIRCGALNSMET